MMVHASLPVTMMRIARCSLPAAPLPTTRKCANPDRDHALPVTMKTRTVPESVIARILATNAMTRIPLPIMPRVCRQFVKQMSTETAMESSMIQNCCTARSIAQNAMMHAAKTKSVFKPATNTAAYSIPKVNSAIRAHVQKTIPNTARPRRLPQNGKNARVITHARSQRA